jgi:hypothetical protein
VLTGHGSVTNPFEHAGDGDLHAAFRDPPARRRSTPSTTAAIRLARAACTSPRPEPGPGDRRARPTLSSTTASANFTAQDSSFRGPAQGSIPELRAPGSPDNGQWFANISDTGYRLFHEIDAPLWKQWVKDSAVEGDHEHPRRAALGGWGETPGADIDSADTWVWNDPWAGGATPDYDRFDLAKFQNTDKRMSWIFNHYRRCTSR